MIPTIMREARGDLTYIEFQELTGIAPSTQQTWETGTQVPASWSADKVADALGWSDDQRMAIMPEPKGEGLSAKLERHMQFLRLDNHQVAKILNKTDRTISTWKAYQIPGKNRTLIRNFLAMDKQEAFALLELKEDRRKKKLKKEKRKQRRLGKFRVKINYVLIYKLEDKYGSLKNVPNDDPILLELQEEMKWAV